MSTRELGPGGRRRDAELRARIAAYLEEISAFFRRNIGGAQKAGAVPPLARLKSAGFATAILSNGAPGMLADAVAGARLDGLIDHVVSVEEVGVFKPHPRVYQRAVDRLGVPASATLAELPALLQNG